MRAKGKFIINYFEEIVCSISLCVTIIAVLTNTILGWTVGKRFGQLEELAITGFVWVTFLGISVVYKRGSHICIDFIVESFPKLIRKYVTLFIDIIIILFSFYVIYFACILAIGAVEKTTSLLNISYFYIDLSAILGFSFMSFHSIKKIVSDIRKIRGGEI